MREQIEAHEKRAGRSMSLIHAYNTPGHNTLTADERYFISRPNTYLLLNWRPSSAWIDAAGGNEETNSDIDVMAAEIKSVEPHKIFLILSHEPEGSVAANDPGGNCTLPKRLVEKGGTPSQYVEMWHNVRARFDKAGVNNVVWVMNYMAYHPYHPCMLKALWPGNQYVDWIAWDPYDHGDGWVATTKYFCDLLTKESNSTHDFVSKPWMLGEYGIHGFVPQQKAYQFYDDAKKSLDTDMFPRLKAYVVFDSIGIFYTQVGFAGGGPPGRKPDPPPYARDDEEQKHYNNFVNDPRLQ